MRWNVKSHFSAKYGALVIHFAIGMSRKFQPRVTFLLHTLDQIFTLSHTQPLNYSHLNIGFLNAELQANLAQNKTNT